MFLPQMQLSRHCQSSNQLLFSQIYPALEMQANAFSGSMDVEKSFVKTEPTYNIGTFRI